MASQADPRQLFLEHVWQICVNRLNQGGTDILLPTNMQTSLGQAGIHTIAQRFSAIINSSIVTFVDPAIDAIRMVKSVASLVPVASFPANTNSVVTAPIAPVNIEGQRKKHSPVHQTIASKRGKVPRPPNAFILYRQQHHPAIKKANPGLHNNEISIILGKQWKEESEDTKAYFKNKAEEVKVKHIEAHPEYQYQPRKPSEKKRRMTRRKAAALAMSASPKQMTPEVTMSAPPEQEASPATTTSVTDSLFEAQDGVTGEEINWAPLDNANFGLTMPQDESIFSDLVDDFNLHHSLVTPLQASFDFAGSNVPSESILDQKTQDDEDFYYNAIDWSLLTGEAADAERDFFAEALTSELSRMPASGIDNQVEPL